MNPGKFSLQRNSTGVILNLLLLICPLSLSFAQESTLKNSQVAHNVYITANTGDAQDTQVLKAISEASQNDNSASLLLVGNATDKGGYPPEDKDRLATEKFLQNNLFSALANFNGEVVITPGLNEWNEDAPQSIDDLESFLQDTGGVEFWPNDGCPLERESLSENVELISVDSQWYLENWNERPEMNTDCEIKTREDFFVEFKDDLKDSHGKVIIVAIHHPVMSNSRIPFLNRLTATNSQNFENQLQKELRDRLETLASLFEDVIFVSGSHRNLQFLRNDRNPQIISGASGSIDPVRNVGDEAFAAAEKGFAKLVFFEDGSSEVQFFSVDGNSRELLSSHSIERERPKLDEVEVEFPHLEDENYSASIYTSEETDRGWIYEWLWGDRYREIYSRPISAPVLILDSLPGNVRPISEGGGQQSRSLRLINDNKNEYTLRAMRKDPIQYLQADLIKTSYIGEFAQNTVAERYVADFFTTAHPYAPFAVNELSTALDISHANPEIFYVPKQEGLDIYNEDYGNALFMLEEHVGDENKELKTFGSPDDILSTTDLLLELRESKDSYVDQDAYLKARLFDMLIGDWDRHSDQWRWAQYSEGDSKRYEPIPRDRDHAFSKYDGPIMVLLKSALPQFRKMQSYGEELDDVKWFNRSGYPLDQSFITTTDWNDWKAQAEYIQENLTDEQIDSAFESLPEEIKDGDLEQIKQSLKGRRANLVDIARDYYEYFQKFQTVIGTSEDNLFEITRKPGGITEIAIFEDEEEIFRNSYSSEETKEIWIYGLDGDDKFELDGEGDKLIDLKILGGEEEDIYAFSNPRKAKLYDYESTELEIKNPKSKKWLVDSYDINRYDYRKRKYSANKIIPVVDWTSGAGAIIGVKDVYTTYGLAQNPFTSQYSFAAQYYFLTNGYQLEASAEYAHVFHNWNFRLAGSYSSPNYFINYFGTGNETSYDGDLSDLVVREFYRVKMEQWEVKPSLIWRNDNGNYFSAGPLLESKEVRSNEDTYVQENFSSENAIFDDQLYAGAELHYNFFTKNRKAFPSLGTELDIVTGYKQNIDEHDNQFGYIIPSVSFDYPLIPSGFAVLATKIGGQVNFGDEYEFYHGATIGGNRSLRGYRNNRFNGKRSFYHTTDLRTALGMARTNFIPFVYGVTAGFDYGRVWTDGGNSERWHNNYGGSIWISAALAVTGQIGFYHGDDGNRLTVALNFKF